MTVDTPRAFAPAPLQLDTIVSCLHHQGWVVVPDFLPEGIVNSLYQHARTEVDFKRAGIGRAQQYQQNSRIRTDQICWLGCDSLVDQVWLGMMEQLRLELNRHLFLGLFEYESHYARYLAGDFYSRHVDAFKGQANRVLTTVFYLNPGWQQQDGGELLLYVPNSNEPKRVTPNGGTLVVFLSEEFPHEVLPANRERYSLTGWFRLNTCSGENLDVEHY